MGDQYGMTKECEGVDALPKLDSVSIISSSAHLLMNSLFLGTNVYELILIWTHSRRIRKSQGTNEKNGSVAKVG